VQDALKILTDFDERIEGGIEFHKIDEEVRKEEWYNSLCERFIVISSFMLSV